MLTLHYEGRYQCRLATDPDPTDEKWGLTGPTFAVAGEPPLDRIIRLQKAAGVPVRAPHDVDFGVFVRQVTLTTAGPMGPETKVLPDHPLVGAAVEMLENPMYHQRNYIVVEGLNSPIDPWIVQVSKDDIRLTRKDEWDETQPGLTILDVYLNPQLAAHRSQTIEVKSPKLVEATGIADYISYWRARKAFLEGQLEGENDPTRQAALRKRIDHIDELKYDSGTRVDARQFLGLLSTYTVDVNGAATVADPQNRLQGKIGTSQVWPMVFWMGAYDVDTLCGYLKGTLALPFYSDPGA